MIALSVPAFVIVVIAYFGPQSYGYFKMRPTLQVLGREGPPRGFRSSLNPLGNIVPSTVDGTSLSYYGYSFEVPWRGIDREQNEGRWVEIDFKSGQIVRFVNPKYFQEDPVIARDDPVITNDGATKYEKYKAVLSMTPSQLSPFCSHQNFARALRLLEIKGM